MKKLAAYLVFILVIFCSPSFAGDYSDVMIYWLKAVGNGIEDIKQPVFYYVWFLRNEHWDYINTFEEYKKPSKYGFTNFLRLTDYLDSSMGEAIVKHKVNHTKDGVKYLDTKLLPQDLIANVLNRRKAIVNNFEYDKSKFADLDKSKYKFELYTPYIYCKSSMSGPTGYLGVVLERLIILLCLSEDLRFEKEISDLLHYILTYRYRGLSIEEVKKDPNYRELHLGTFHIVDSMCVNYLNFFRRERGESLINPWNHEDWGEYKSSR